MKYQFPGKRTAKTLDEMADALAAPLTEIDTAIAEMDAGSKFNALCFVTEYGDFRDEHHRILREKLEKANAADSARGDHDLDIHLESPGWRIGAHSRHNWQITVMDGHIAVASIEFPTFEEGKAAFDALCELIRIAGREGQFTYETPRPDGHTRADPVPF